MAESKEQDEGRVSEERERDASICNDSGDEAEGRSERMTKRKRRALLKDDIFMEEGGGGGHDKRGVCYFSRVPPHMDPSNFRQILSKFGEVLRIYLAPQETTSQVQQKKSGGFQRKQFTEGWVEFAKKSVAKRVVNMLNGEQIGGRKRSSFYYDIWNIKYLHKFKWDDLISEIAEKNRTREQKQAMELSAAKKERDFYMLKVEQARALSSMQERVKKKQKKTEEASSEGTGGEVEEIPKVIRKFPQNRPVDKAVLNKPKLSEDFLAGVFRGSS